MLQGEHSAILSTFIKLTFVINIFVLSIYELPLKTGFTVGVYYSKLFFLFLVSMSTQNTHVSIACLLTITYLCHLLICFTNSLDPDQAQQNKVWRHIPPSLVLETQFSHFCNHFNELYRETIVKMIFVYLAVYKIQFFDKHAF